MMLCRGPTLHGRRRRNQAECVILALGQNPKRCILGHLLPLGPRYHLTQTSQVGQNSGQMFWSIWIRLWACPQNWRLCEECSRANKDVVEAPLSRLQMMRTSRETKMKQGTIVKMRKQVMM
ncbi:hypothetical protein LINPERHAP2_LOCUS20796, partial [Linum perenne]